MEEIILRFDSVSIAELTLYKRKEILSDGEEPIYEYIPIGTLPAGSYSTSLEGDHTNGMNRIQYYSGGNKEAWVKNGYRIPTDTPIYFIHSESTAYVHHYIASNPARLAEYMACQAPGRAYTTIPPWQWDENPPEVNVSTPTPAPTEETTDEPAETNKPTGNTSRATKKPSPTKKPSATKQAKATSTPPAPRTVRSASCSWG